MTRTIRILIIEDSESDAFLMLRQLRNDGYSPVYQLVDTEEAMREALNNEQWDIVTSDYVLPGFSGLEAIQIVKEKNPDLPCIIISGKISDEIAVAAMKAGAHDYVMKDNLKRLGPAIAREIEEAKVRLEHNKAKEQLKQKEIQLQQLFDAMTEAVAMIDAEGKIIQTNPAEKQMLGFAVGPESGPYYYNFYRGNGTALIHPDGTPFSVDQMAVTKALREKWVVYNVEVGMARPGNLTKWFSASAAPIFDESGNVIGAVRTMTDITEQKLLRDEREYYLRKITGAQEEERKRIARELHDDTAQSLALLLLETDSILLQKDNLPQDITQRLERLRSETNRTMEEVRRFSHELRPGVLDQLGLISALEQLVEENSDRRRIEISFDISGTEKRLPPDVELTFFRIAQEALNNVWKHSQASRVDVTLCFDEDYTQLSIVDDGKGFEHNEELNAIQKGHLGLIGMKERARLVNAELRLESAAGRGTLVCIKVAH